LQTTDHAATTRLIKDMFAALNAHDVDAILTLITDDCVFENTGPAPDGTRYTGKQEIRDFFSEFFANTPNANFKLETTLVGEDHATVMHRYTWSDTPGTNDPGSVRGVSICTMKDGKIAELYAYVKG
jgi:uncharacterized protein (TIGR02246 family)